MLDKALLSLDMLVALMDLGGLRESGALLVNGLRREQPGHFGAQLLEPHRAVALEQRVKGVVADPRFVPQNVVAEVADFFQHLSNVVDSAVVGRELDTGEAERACGGEALRIRHERMFSDLLAQVTLVPCVPVDSADHSERIAGSRQEDRNGPGLDQCALVQRFVVVAVEQNKVAAAKHRVGDDFVRCARAVQHEICFVGAKHARRVFLSLDGRALVDQQIAEVDIGIAQIVAEDGFAEMLEEELAGGRFAIELATLMAGAIKGDIGFTVIRHQPAEERRQQGQPVFHDTRDDLLGVKRGRLLPEVDVAAHLAGEPEDGEIGDAVRIRKPPKRRVKPVGADRPSKVASLFEPLAIDQRNVGADRRVLRYVPLEAMADLDLKILSSDVIDQLLCLRIRRVDDRNHLQQLMKRDRDGRRPDVARDHWPIPRLTQSTR